MARFIKADKYCMAHMTSADTMSTPKVFTVKLTNPGHGDSKELEFATMRGAQAFVRYVDKHPAKSWYYTSPILKGGDPQMIQDYQNAYGVFHWLELAYPRILPYLIQLIDPKTFQGPFDLDETGLRKIGI